MPCQSALRRGGWPAEALSLREPVSDPGADIDEMGNGVLSEDDLVEQASTLVPITPMLTTVLVSTLTSAAAVFGDRDGCPDRSCTDPGIGMGAGRKSGRSHPTLPDMRLRSGRLDLLAAKLSPTVVHPCQAHKTNGMAPHRPPSRCSFRAGSSPYNTAAIAFATTGRFLPFRAATLMRPEATA